MERYSRQIALPELGPEGQRRLGRARVLVAGAGGLGSPALSYLAAAGVGTLGIADFDAVELSNLQRQVMYAAPDIGVAKTAAAARRIRDMNPAVDVKLHETRLTAANARSILGGYDVVIDGTDSIAARYLISDACAILGIPDVYGSVWRFDGQVSVLCHPEGPCYRCLFPEPPDPGAVASCDEAGVLGALPGIIGSIQAAETIKLVIGRGKPLIGRLLVLDALDMRFRELTVDRDPACPFHGESAQAQGLTDLGVRPGLDDEISAESLRARLDAGEDIVILDVREPDEAGKGMIPGSFLVPLDDLPIRVPGLPRAALTVACCRTGNRSARAVRLLRSAGIENVRSLGGGMVAWVAAGGEVKRGGP